MKKLLVIALALTLSGCVAAEKVKTFVGNVVETVVNPDTVENVMIAYNSVQKVGLAYGRSCKARLIPKSCWNVIAQLKPYEARATEAVLDLDDFSRKYPTADNTSLIKIAKDAIKQLKDTQFINGVQ